MFEPRDPRTFDIYRKLMEWMEAGRATHPVLAIPVIEKMEAPLDGTAVPDLQTTTKTLRFRKTYAMGEQVWVDSEDKPGVRIYYDRNWRDFLTIEELLASPDAR
jgi:hypothetical protein